MKNKILPGAFFCGHEASDYAKEHGYLDYETLSKAFDLVHNDNIFSAIDDWEQINGFIDNSEEIKKIEELIGFLKEEQYDLDFDDDEEYENRSESIQIDIDRLENAISELEEQMEERTVYQYYIISGNGAEILRYWTDEIVYYSYKLDMYVWGVTHVGTSWDYVLTDIELNQQKESQEEIL